jgi:hypothetical protein
MLYKHFLDKVPAAKHADVLAVFQTIAGLEAL